MDRAALFAQLGAPEGTVVQSAEQTAGRGRGGRAWHSPAGCAVYATIVLRPLVPPDRLSTLPLLAGVAVAEAIEAATQADVFLKWPNDVWLGSRVDGQKVAGILLTSRLDGARVSHVLVGIGINVATPADALPAGATSILSATGVHVHPNSLLDALLDRFELGYATFLATAGRPSLDHWRERAALIGESVKIEESGQRLIGRYRGVDEDGALLLEDTNGEVRRIVSGDLGRGPSSVPRSS